MMNYVMLYTTSKKMMVYITIKGLEEQLPADTFIKVHKSFIVNIGKIKSIEGNILNVGNEKIAISQNLREKVISEIVKDKETDKTLTPFILKNKVTKEGVAVTKQRESLLMDNTQTDSENEYLKLAIDTIPPEFHQ